jgi:hypothetical protein
MNIIASINVISIAICAILNGIFSTIAQVILKKNGYSIDYFFTNFFYEIKILKKICVDNKNLYPLIMAYTIVVYLLFINIALLLIIVIIKASSI